MIYIPKYFIRFLKFSFQIFFFWIFFFENFNISKNNTISVELAQVLWYNSYNLANAMISRLKYKTSTYNSTFSFSSEAS
jgi:hypothetical protein